MSIDGVKTVLVIGDTPGKGAPLLISALKGAGYEAIYFAPEDGDKMRGINADLVIFDEEGDWNIEVSELAAKEVNALFDELVMSPVQSSSYPYKSKTPLPPVQYGPPRKGKRGRAKRW